METKAERPQSHEDRKTQKLVKRIEQRQVSEDAAREAETKRTLDDYAKKSRQLMSDSTRAHGLVMGAV
jgi:hypothetical protein